MELKAKITGTHKIEELSGDKTLWKKPIDDLGFTVAHFITVGLTASYKIGFATKLLASATFTFGATSSLPDGKGLIIDIVNPDKSGYITDESTLPSADSIMEIDEMTGSVKFAVFSQADLVWGIDIEDVVKADIEFNLKIPQFSATLTAGYSKYRFHHRLPLSPFPFLPTMK